MIILSLLLLIASFIYLFIYCEFILIVKCNMSAVIRYFCFMFQGDQTDGGLGLTQGDKLRALKSRRFPRPATTSALRY